MNVWSVVKTTLLYILFVIIGVTMFTLAILQQSYRMTPPTEEELVDNPSLIVYKGE